MQRTLILSSLLLLTLTCPTSADEPKPRFEQRWFYAMHNLLVDKNADDLIGLIRRAHKSGYNGVVIADYKLNILDRMKRTNYFKNVERVKAAADEANIEIIPSIFPIGYSDGLLAHDPNLAEGLPVIDAPFIVKGTEAQLDPATAPKLANAGFEETRGDRFVGFSFQDDPGVVSFADHDVVHGGKVSCRMQDVGKSSTGNCRLIQKVKVRPHACYRFSCWVKVKDLQPARAFHLLAIGAKTGRSLTFHETHFKPTQDWTEVEVIINSLEDDELNLYAGQWSGKSGTLWLDDLKLEELQLVNVLRRAGCPLVVTSADDKTIYEEGKDFQPVRDPKLGMVPYAGHFSFRHAGPAITLTADSRIKDGDRLKVSWYHPVQIHGEQMMCCLSDPKVYELLRDQARRVHGLLKPKTYLMAHDEIRVANWCKTCQATGKTPGAMLADNARRCVEILKDVNPKVKIVVWNDMFDPHHNAVDKYYLVNGSWRESWKGLPPEVIIANWNGGKAEKSLKFFAERGHTQIIAGYYDSGATNFHKWAKASQDVPRVTGFMYTTWQQKYDDLELYGRLMLGKE
jgi:hypothetical protein